MNKDPTIAGANGVWERCNQHGWPSEQGKRYQIKVGPFVVMECPRPRCVTYELRPSAEFEPWLMDSTPQASNDAIRRAALKVLRKRLVAGIDAIDQANGEVGAEVELTRIRAALGLSAEAPLEQEAALIRKERDDLRQQVTEMAKDLERLRNDSWMVESEPGYVVASTYNFGMDTPPMTPNKQLALRGTLDEMLEVRDTIKSNWGFCSLPSEQIRRNAWRLVR